MTAATKLGDNPLATPLELPCGVVLPNRLAKAATSEHLGDPATGLPTQSLCDLYRRWAEGGSGLLITGNVMVDSRYLEGPSNVTVPSDVSISAPPALWREWANACHATFANGSARPVAIVQLGHPGRQCPLSVLGLERPPAPSAVGFRLPGVGLPLFREPRELEAAEIERIPQQFARAAALSLAAGFDGVQVHAAHGYLLSQFLSPHTNRRQDAWGGDAVRRRRLLLEVVKAVRAAMGPKGVLSVKVNSRDFRAGGLDEDEAASVVSALHAAGGVDLVEVSGGTYEHMVSLAAPGEGYFLGFARRLRRELPSLAVMATGGFRTAGRCAAALSDGGCDVVGLCRPLCVDPALPLRWISLKAAPPETPMPADLAADIRLQVPFFRGLLVPGLGYFWHQRQLQRLGQGLPVEKQPTAGVLWQLLLLNTARAYLWEPRRPGAMRRALVAAAVLLAVAAGARSVLGRLLVAVSRRLS